MLLLPASLEAKVLAGKPKMGDFLLGMIDNMLTVEKGQLSISELISMIYINSLS